LERKLFNFNLLHEILSNACKMVDGISSVACPFGFELLRDQRYWQISPRRLYTLATCNPYTEKNEQQLAETFLENVMILLKRDYPELARSIVLLRFNGSSSIRLRPDGYQCTDTDRLLSVLVRRTRSTVVEDYAHYLIGVLGGIEQRTLGELARFGIDTRARRRFAQLLTMLDHLVCNALGIGNPQGIYTLDTPSEFQDFFDGRTQSPATQNEMEFLEDIALPRFRSLLTTVRQFENGLEDSTIIAADDLYGRTRLTTTLNRHAAKRIIQEVDSSLSAFFSNPARL